MAIYRTISMTFWTDAKIVDDFTPEDRYFYLYLFTNPHTNLCGCYEVSLRQMVNELGYSRESIENLIKRFSCVHNVIRYSAATKEILLLNWYKYNWTKSEKFRKPLMKEIANIKDDGFREYLTQISSDDFDGYGIDTKCIDTTVTVTDTVTDTVSDSDSDSNKVKRHKYGEYKNVLLSDEELKKLKTEFPADWDQWIERLSSGIASKGYSYKNHLATIRNWAKRDREKEKPKDRYSDVDDWLRRSGGIP